MPRHPRNFLKTCFFHIITQGINKTYIFSKDEDIRYYIKLMYLLKEEHNIKIIAYCIMHNHAHILVETQNIKELSKYMQRINIRYGIYYNKKYKRVGYVFRDRYRSQGIYTEKQLYNCIRYIYDNPVKAGICTRAKDYQFSNYKEIPKHEVEGYFIDIEEDTDNCEKLIEKYVKDKKICIGQLKQDKKIIGEIVKMLHNENNISLRKIAEALELPRENIRRIYNDK